MTILSTNYTIQEDEIPSNPRERGNYYRKHFGGKLNTHLSNLFTCCKYLPEGQGISFSGIEEGYMHAYYGKYSIFFPIADFGEITRFVDWKNLFDLEIDGNITPIDYKLKKVQDNTKQAVEVVHGIKNLLLPKRVDNPRETLNTSQNVTIFKTIRIIPKMN